MTNPQWDSIVLHCSYNFGQNDGTYFDWPGIVSHHVNELKYDYVGYHAGIERVSGHMVICPGRSQYREGAHCKDSGMNFRALGLVAIGNFDLEPPDRLLYFTIAEVCKLFMLKYPAIKLSGIFPHSDFSKKSCPGKMFDIDKLKYLIQNVV